MLHSCTACVLLQPGEIVDQMFGKVKRGLVLEKLVESNFLFYDCAAPCVQLGALSDKAIRQRAQLILST